MRKRFFLFLCVIVPLFLVSCASSKQNDGYAGAGAHAAGGATYTVFLHDNCPDNSYARLARASVKAENRSYKGVVRLDYSESDDAGVFNTVASYKRYCSMIQEAISGGTGYLCTLTFNTSPNGNGVNLNFSTDADISSSLDKLTRLGKNNVYAIYGY